MKATDQIYTAAKGLSADEVVRSRREKGANVLSRKKRRGFWRCFLANLNDPVIRILLGSLALNLLLLFRNGDVIETVGIGVAVFLATFISTLSEYGSARAFERLSDQNSNGICRVRRDGRVCEIPFSEVVVGDIVLLSAGDRIPADGFLVRGELFSDQSAMTGESREIRKRPSAPYTLEPSSPAALFRGCTVTRNAGEMCVAAVGDGTALGEISREIQTETRESPLKLRLGKLAKQISVLGYIAAVLVALVYLFNVFFLESGMQRAVILLKISDMNYLFSHLMHALTLGLTVLVTCVPEGLPMMVAVVLSSNIKRMVRDRVLVRKAVGIEAAGSMNLLFTDKTGTLTEGKMRLSACLSPEGEKRSLEGMMAERSERARWLGLALRFGSEATPGKDANGRASALGGNATARAMLESVLSHPIPAGVEVVSRLLFDSRRKYAAVTLGGKERGTILLGAPEMLFPYTSKSLAADGRVLPFSRQKTDRILQKETQNGARVLAVVLSLGNVPAPMHADGIRGELIYLGAVSLSDPIRAEAPRAVGDLQGAGVQVVMVTGDSRETAMGIATHCGILNGQNDLVLTGEELSRMNDERVRDLLPRLAVVARALPTDKSRLVRLSQEKGCVVGMTGDGINDAPALKRADIGFSMGSGTQVAKDAGDIIILDNNLASIVRAVLYGRSIFKSIRKFITLQLTMNFCAVGVTMICPFLGFEAPVTVVQMLWINLIMDTLGGLAFAGEPPRLEYLKEPPKRREEPILNRYMVDQIVTLGAFTVSLCIYFIKSPTVTSLFRPHPDHLYLLTAFFALFIFSSVFNCFNARTDRLKITSGLLRNPVFLIIMVAILVIQIAFVYLGGSVLRTAPLTPTELLVTMLLSLSVFPADLIRKAVWRLRKKKEGSFF